MEAQDKERTTARQKAAPKIKPRLPLKEIDDRNKKRIRELNGEFLNLYRVLGHHANLLSAWIEFAYTLRRDCTTSRSLRELMIPVSYTHLRAHETPEHLVCRLLLEKK